MMRDPLKFLASLPRYGDLVVIRLGPVPAVVVCDPELTTKIFRNEKYFGKGGFVYEKVRELLTGEYGLVTCPYESHMRLRRMISPVFGSKTIGLYESAMREEWAATCDSWSNGQVVDLLHEATRTNVRIGERSLFSGSLTPEQSARWSEDLSTLLDGAFARMILPDFVRWVPYPANIRFNRARKRLDASCREIIANRRNSGKSYHDLLAELMTVREGGSLTDQELKDNIMTFFFGATDTASSSIANTLYLVSVDAALERDVVSEIRSVADPRERKLVSLALTETLRMYPPVYLLTRQAEGDDVYLMNCHIPAGTTLVVSPFVLHHRADLFPEPEVYNPERWVDWKEKRPGSMVPFGAGARKCPGDDYGMLDSIIAVSTILSRFRLHPVSAFKQSPRTVLNPGDLRMRVEVR